MQVITACEGSVICFWSLETGRKMVELTEAHGNEEISCMALDPTKSRLFTGTREGSIHVCMTGFYFECSVYMPVLNSRAPKKKIQPIRRQKSRCIFYGMQRVVFHSIFPSFSRA